MKRWTFLAILLVAPLVAAGPAQADRLKPQLLDLTFNGAQLGMTRAQVDKLLGSSSGQITIRSGNGHTLGISQIWVQYTLGKTGKVRIFFDPAGAQEAPTASQIEADCATFGVHKTVYAGAPATGFPGGPRPVNRLEGPNIYEGREPSFEGEFWYFPVVHGYARISFKKEVFQSVRLSTLPFENKAAHDKRDWDDRAK